MEILEQSQGAVTVLKPRGPLCAQDAEQFKQCALRIMERSLGRFVVDASDIPYLDSRGLEVLKETTDTLAERGLALRLCGANETVREVLEITDIAQHFEYYTDTGSAVRSFL